jgi:phosphoacetylglucosamine mutase
VPFTLLIRSRHFHTRGATLASTLLRVGMLAVLRSKKLDGRTIGVMITASHNPAEVRRLKWLYTRPRLIRSMNAQDNGAKLIDPRGEMLDPTWEAYATTVANAETASDLLKALTQLVDSLKIDLAKPSSVIYGRDTRPSGHELNDALQTGIKAMGQDDVELVDLGIVTTPCVHYAVKSRNLKGEERKAYGEPTLEGYLSKIADAFNQLMVSLCRAPSSRSHIQLTRAPIRLEGGRPLLLSSTVPTGSDSRPCSCSNR